MYKNNLLKLFPKTQCTLTRGRLGVPFIYLFVYSCWSYRMIARMLCYHSTAASTCKASMLVPFAVFRGLLQLIGVYVGLHRFLLGALLAYPVISFYFAALWVHSMTLRQLTVRTNLLYQVPVIYFHGEKKLFVVRALVKENLKLHTYNSYTGHQPLEPETQYSVLIFLRVGPSVGLSLIRIAWCRCMRIRNDF